MPNQVLPLIPWNKEWLLSSVVGRRKVTIWRVRNSYSLFDVQSHQNPFFKIVKVPETKGFALDNLNQIIGRFKFSVGIRQLKCVDNLISIP